MPEYEAKQYADKIRGGNFLISVHTEDSNERRRAKEIFEHHQAKDIATAGEEAVAGASAAAR